MHIFSIYLIFQNMICLCIFWMIKIWDTINAEETFSIQLIHMYIICGDVISSWDTVGHQSNQAQTGRVATNQHGCYGLPSNHQFNEP